MKIQLGAALIAVLALGGCAPQTDATKQQAAATPVAGATAASAPAAAGATGTGDQTQTAQATPKKKKCADATTGSRLGSCNGMVADSVQGSTGDDYRNSAMIPNTYSAKPN